MGESWHHSARVKNMQANTRTSFGAVMEEFEVRDSLLALFAEKDGVPVRGQFFAPHEVPVYA